MTTSIELASTPTVDTPGTVLLVRSDKHVYVFGRVSEGSQRAFNARRIGMSATEQVFLSGTVCWEQVSGLFGYLLTVGGALEASREQVTITNAERQAKGLKTQKVPTIETVGVHGGDNLCHSLAACRPVILRQPVSVKTIEHRKDPRLEDPSNIQPDWQDDGIRVWKLPVRRARSSSPQKRRLATPDDPEKDGQIEGDQIFKKKEGPSDPAIASLVVQSLMFNGELSSTGVLIPKKLRDVKATDTVMILKDGQLQRYTGPHADNETDQLDGDETVYIVPSRLDKVDTTGDVVQLTHRPLPPTAYSEVSMSYIVKCHDRRGKFNPKIAKELGVANYDFKILTNGRSVQGKDGNTVTPEMVLGESQPGKGFIVADIPSPDFIDNFVTRPEWENKELMVHISYVYWIIGEGMVNDPRIQKFVRDHADMKHIFSASDICPNTLALTGPAELQVRLRRVDPERFSLLQFENTVNTVPEEPKAEIAHTGNKVTVMPRLVFDKEENPFPDLVAAASSVSPEVLELAQKASEEATSPGFLKRSEEEDKDMPNRDAEVIPLGTGSSVPGKYRNVSGTLIRVPGIGSYVLDCGEGTLGQIRRLFGKEESRQILRELRCIVVSHLHADHHLGVPTLIKAWYEENIHDLDAKLAISCIARYRLLLEELSQVEDIGFHRLRFVSCTSGKDKKLTTREELEEDGNTGFGLAAVKRIPITHCWRSFATELELTSGLRIAYSGDCRPSADFARECLGAHLLVHECTFDDDMQSHAKNKKHSTMKEALGVASSMRARRVLLTHFSQRYVKADSLKRAASATSVGPDQAVLMAYDHMRVRLGDFRKAALYQPAIQTMLAQLAEK